MPEYSFYIVCGFADVETAKNIAEWLHQGSDIGFENSPESSAVKCLDDKNSLFILSEITECRRHEEFLIVTTSGGKAINRANEYHQLFIKLGAQLLAVSTHHDYSARRSCYTFDHNTAISQQDLYQKVSIRNQLVALYLAIKQGLDMGMLSKLIINGINLNSRVFGRPLTAVATKSNNLAALRFLLKLGANGDLTSEIGLQNNALHHAVVMFKSQYLYEILKYKPDVNVSNAMGNTPLHEALCSDAPLSNALMLVRVGADLQIRNHAGLTPFLCLMDNHDHELAAIKDLCLLMFEYGTNVDETCSQGGNALWYAGDNQQLVAFLKQCGLSVLSAPEGAYSGKIFFDFDLALRVNDAAKLDQLGEALNMLSRIEKNQLLYTAVDYQNIMGITILIKQGADRFYQTAGGVSLQELARQKGEPEILRLITDI